MFIDEMKVHARAGHGGKGAVAFHREAFVEKGGPSGGNGGRGGEVILEGDRDINNLIGLYYQPKLHAQDGRPGLGRGMDGAAGKDLIVKVPCGTLVWRVGGAPVQEPTLPNDEEEPASLPVSTKGRPLLRRASGARAWEVDLEKEDHPHAPGGVPKGELMADITEHGQRFVLCKAGRGGLGNRNFATARRQTPRFAQPGEPGDEGDFLCELRIMAEVGVVGYPNAGKSTLLTAISRARPKIAPYPFTTLHPQIGIVEYNDFFRLTVCDVPGLIEGAHNNVGLGHSFLRHIQRCKVLVLLLDMAGTDGREPWDDYKHLLEELELYDPSLLKRPRLVVANKMDEPVSEKKLKQFKRKIPRTKVLPISAGLDEGVAEFKKRIREAVGATVSV
jgi:GTP-binding protein